MGLEASHDLQEPARILIAGPVHDDTVEWVFHLLWFFLRLHTSPHLAMFAVLPRDIVQCVVQEYLLLDLRGWSRIDVAFCSHGFRADWLSILAQADVTCKQVLQNTTATVGYLHWIAKRNVQQKQLWLDPHLMAVGDLQVELPTVTQIEFHNCTPSVDVDAAPIAAFLSCFPSIEEFSFRMQVQQYGQETQPGWTKLQDKHLLLGFTKLHCPLQSLDLLFCEQVSAAAIAQMVSRFAQTLRSLRCTRLDDPALATIAKLCRHLTSFHIALDYITDTALLYQLLVSNELVSLSLC